MKNYKCPICGKKHSVYSGLEISIPSEMYDMSEEERVTRVEEFTKGFFFVDKKDFYVNGWLYLGVENEAYPFFTYNLCASIDHQQFLANLDELKSGEHVVFNGKLANELPQYPNSIELKVKVTIQLTEEDIEIEFTVTEESQLKNDQVKPMTKDRVIELMTFFHHNEAHNKDEFNASFEKRFQEAIIQVQKDFIDRGETFGINLSADGSACFQIIANQMLEKMDSEILGFGIHLPFDQSFEEEIEKLVKFKKTDLVNQFDYYLLDGIPTYQKDLVRDIDLLEVIVKQLITEVYQQKLDNINIESFEI
ncbi:MAG: DUF2199 domain-containing protein [Bacteroidota bacterium]